MFGRSARLYDAIYSFKDYEAEALEIRDLIRKRYRGAATLLDVACGTGLHLEQLAGSFRVEGLDLDPELLAIAAERLGDVPLHEGDMRTFDLGKTFDAVTCLFSSIGYMRTRDELEAACERMAAHLAPQGVLVIEGWFSRSEWDDGHVGAAFVDRPDLKVARMNLSTTRDDLSVMEFHYLVARPGGIEHFTELHELHLFERDEYVAALEAVGLAVERDDDALMGRGVYIGVKP